MRRVVAQLACAAILGAGLGQIASLSEHSPASGVTPATAQPSSVAQVGAPSLRQGASGAWVRTLQIRLNELDDTVCWWWKPCLAGYRITVDGTFGASTRRAVVQFQIQQMLAPDGIVGPKTWSRLYRPTPPCELARIALVRGGASAWEAGFGVMVARRETGCHVTLHVWRPSTGDNTYGAWGVNYYGPLIARERTLAPRWANTASWVSGARIFLKLGRESGWCHWQKPNYCKGK